MFNIDNKVLVVLIGLLAVAFAFCQLNKSNSHEKFLGNLPSMKTKVQPVVQNQKGQFYSIPGQYQSLLAPRSASVDYGANIRYNLPSYSNQAVPKDPLAMGDMISNCSKENYEHCDKTKPGQAAGNYNEKVDSLYDSSEYTEAQSMLPVGTMASMNAAGEVTQPIVYDRLITVANRNNRLRAQGDPIRGDLACIPRATGWFRPSVHPQLDLQQGALNVMAGVRNDTANQLASLIASASGGAETTISGINMANMFTTDLGAAQSDINVTAFP